MKYRIVLAAAISAALVGCNEKSAAPQEGAVMQLETEQQRVSYGMGVGLGKRIAQESFDVDIAAFAAGLEHGQSGSEQLMSDEEIGTQMQAFQEKQMQQQQAEYDAIADKNKADGEAFLAENGQKEGVVTTDSGLQYKVLTAGEGETPAAEDVVEVHYRGTLLDGTEFDSSYKRDSTVTFPVNGVIPGWVEALQLMPVGSKWQLFIPSELAYGPGGTGGGPIGPNATLIFEVELIGIQAEEAAQEASEG